MDLPANEILIDNNLFVIEAVDSDAVDGNLGEMSGKNKRIRLAYEQTPSDLVDTFWHEVLHAVIACRGRGVLKLKEADEEAVISVLAGGIVQVMRDNPEWAEWAIKMGNDHCRRSSPVSSPLPTKEKKNGRSRKDGSSVEGTTDGRGRIRKS